MPAFDRRGSQQLVSWQDMARDPSESMYPDMWDTVDGYWLTELGQTGGKLINLAPTGSKFDGTLENDGADPIPAWVPLSEDGRPSLTFESEHNDARVAIGGILIPDARQGGAAPIRNELTIGAYIHKLSETGDGRYLAKAASTTASEHDYMIGQTSTDNMRTRIRVDSTVHTDISTGAGGNGVTHFYCATFDGVDIKHWRDGVEIGSFATSGTLTFRTGSTYKLWLGNNNDGAAPARAEIAMWLVAGRVFQPWEMQVLAADPAALVRRRPTMVSAFVPAAAGGLSIPVAYHHYQRNTG